MSQGTYFMHYRTCQNGNLVQPNGGATLAIRQVGDDKLVVSIARCRKTDVFNKKLGRTIAEGRLNAFLNTDKEMTKDVLRIIELTGFEGEPIKTIVDEVMGSEMEAQGLF